MRLTPASSPVGLRLSPHHSVGASSCPRPLVASHTLSTHRSRLKLCFSSALESEWPMTPELASSAIEDISWYARARECELRIDMASTPQELVDVVVGKTMEVRLFPESASSVLLKLVMWQADKTLENSRVPDSELNAAVVALETQILLDIESVNPADMANILWSLAHLRERPNQESRTAEESDTDTESSSGTISGTNTPWSAAAAARADALASSSSTEGSSGTSSSTNTPWPANTEFIDGVVAWSDTQIPSAETASAATPAIISGLSLVGPKELASLMWGFGVIASQDKRSPKRPGPGFTQDTGPPHGQDPGPGRASMATGNLGHLQGHASSHQEHDGQAYLDPQQLNGLGGARVGNGQACVDTQQRDGQACLDTQQKNGQGGLLVGNRHSSLYMGAARELNGQSRRHADTQATNGYVYAQGALGYMDDLSSGTQRVLSGRDAQRELSGREAGGKLESFAGEKQEGSWREAGRKLSGRDEFLDSLSAFLTGKLKTPLLCPFQPVDLVDIARGLAGTGYRSPTTMALMEAVAKEVNRQMSKRMKGTAPFQPANEVKLLRAFADMGVTGEATRSMFTLFVELITTRIEGRSPYALSKPIDMMTLLETMLDCGLCTSQLPALASACDEQLMLLATSHNETLLGDASFVPVPPTNSTNSTNLDPWRQRQLSTSLKSMTSSWRCFMSSTTCVAILRSFHRLGFQPNANTITSIVLSLLHQLAGASPASVTSLVEMLAEFRHHPGKGTLNMLLSSVSRKLPMYTRRQRLRVVCACTILNHTPPQDVTDSIFLSQLPTPPPVLSPSPASTAAAGPSSTAPTPGSTSGHAPRSGPEKKQGLVSFGIKILQVIASTLAPLLGTQVKSSRDHSRWYQLMRGEAVPGPRQGSSDPGQSSAPPVGSSSSNSHSYSNSSTPEVSSSSAPAGSSCYNRGSSRVKWTRLMSGQAAGQGLGYDDSVASWGEQQQQQQRRQREGEAQASFSQAQHPQGTAAAAAGSSLPNTQPASEGSSSNIPGFSPSGRLSLEANLKEADVCSLLFALVVSGQLTLDHFYCACKQLQHTAGSAPLHPNPSAPLSEILEARQRRMWGLVAVAAAALQLGEGGKRVMEHCLPQEYVSDVQEALSRYMSDWATSLSAICDTYRPQLRSALQAGGLSTQLTPNPISSPHADLVGPHLLAVAPRAEASDSGGPQQGFSQAQGRGAAPCWVLFDVCDGRQVASNKAEFVLGEAVFRQHLLTAMGAMHSVPVSANMLQSLTPDDCAKYLTEQMIEADVVLAKELGGRVGATPSMAAQ